MQLNTYIFFDGNCEEAFTAYRQVLGGTIGRLVRYRDMGPSSQTPPGWDDKIMHMRLDIGDRSLMASDAPPGRFGQSAGYYVQLSVPTREEAERVYMALKEGGRVNMELQETMWSKAFAMIVDRFGIPWMINCDKPM